MTKTDVRFHTTRRMRGRLGARKRAPPTTRERTGFRMLRPTAPFVPPLHLPTGELPKGNTPAIRDAPLPFDSVKVAWDLRPYGFGTLELLHHRLSGERTISLDRLVIATEPALPPTQLRKIPTMSFGVGDYDAALDISPADPAPLPSARAAAAASCNSGSVADAADDREVPFTFGGYAYRLLLDGVRLEPLPMITPPSLNTPRERAESARREAAEAAARAEEVQAQLTAREANVLGGAASDEDGGGEGVVGEGGVGEGGDGRRAQQKRPMGRFVLPPPPAFSPRGRAPPSSQPHPHSTTMPPPVPLPSPSPVQSSPRHASPRHGPTLAPTLPPTPALAPGSPPRPPPLANESTASTPARPQPASPTPAPLYKSLSGAIADTTAQSMGGRSGKRRGGRRGSTRFRDADRNDQTAVTEGLCPPIDWESCMDSEPQIVFTTLNDLRERDPAVDPPSPSRHHLARTDHADAVGMERKRVMAAMRRAGLQLSRQLSADGATRFTCVCATEGACLSHTHAHAHTLSPAPSPLHISPIAHPTYRSADARGASHWNGEAPSARVHDTSHTREGGGHRAYL